MIGLSAAHLSSISQELKEGVCNALVNLTIARVSGSDNEGRILYGRSPRRAIVSGQLLPRFDPTGQDDETSDIRIAASGLDFHISAQAAGQSTIAPSFSVYIRVLPDWHELADEALGLDVDFKLRRAVQDAIDNRFRQLRTERFTAARVATPDWPNLNPEQRQRIYQQRQAILEEVRRQAYHEQGIELEPGDESLLNVNGPDAANLPVPNPGPQDVQADGADDQNAQLRIGRLLQRGRSVPFALMEPVAAPPKWRRIDLTFAPLVWQFQTDATQLATQVGDYSRTMRDSALRQVTDWITSPEGLAQIWRDVRVQPQDVISEAAWNAFRCRAAQTPPSLPDVLPAIGGVALQLDRTPDFVDPTRVAVRVMLDNSSPELSRRDALTRCEVIFVTQLGVTLPTGVHQPLRLDRVEPSYRFRHFMHYAAIGLNCGVASLQTGDVLTLRTTWSPRFVQPRIVPRAPNAPVAFADLAAENRDVADLLAIPQAYIAWIAQEETRLRTAVREGLTPAEANIESARLEQDLRDQRREAGYIERGIRLLSQSHEAYRALPSASASQRATLERRAAPYRAWLMMNESFLNRDNGDPRRGWRLFQLAFILAHVPTFASRMEEYRDSFDPLLDEAAASLLYFPTGGGKSEAFYGTLIFAMFLDRLRGKSRGVTAMIRYPLRLLTLQQGQRLLRLVTAAELVRTNRGIGGWPFEIGFWVGGNNTPNRYSYVPAIVPRTDDADHPDDQQLEEGANVIDPEAQRAAARYREFRAAFNKVPHCPCCGGATGLRRFESEGTTARRLGIVCFDSRCIFNRAHTTRTPLPFLLTDDTIYARSPSIVLGTIDKLAMLGQRTTTIRQLIGMFGLARGIGPTGHLTSPANEGDISAWLTGDGYQPVFPAFRQGQRVFFDPFPSLIIQDEAHLLQESLGTFSGLFDSLLEEVFTEIDQLAGGELNVSRVQQGSGTGRPRTPKVIAATATISNPDRQLEVLYQRLPLRFPCPGPDIYRSFFAEPAPAPAENLARAALEQTLPLYDIPERTSPWMRLFVSLMTNDATHTVTAVAVLSAYHSIITDVWRRSLDPATRQATADDLASSQGNDEGSAWRRDAIRRALQAGRENDLFALIDLHRITLAYVTNKKGGDQVMDALDAAVRLRHRTRHQPLDGFVSRLISGGIDMKEIQEIMVEAEAGNPGQPYPPLDTQLRSVVATSAISHGVDVDRFNSMFFAGLPSDIAEYIQASSRVGRTHVGFVMLVPIPQSRRDRYVVETHDIFHRFLERMIAPPAVERWAENAIRRVMASLIQTWAVMREIQSFVRAPDAAKARTDCFETISPIRTLIRTDPAGLAAELGNFVLRAIGFQGRGEDALGRPIYSELYRALVEQEIARFVSSVRNFDTPLRLYEYWEDSAAAFRPPMTSLRDVDEAGVIAAASFDARITQGRRTIDQDDLVRVMRAIRQQRGSVAETDVDAPARTP
ncbi:helicase-related protein [Bradyrhizobium huanghuaihaiense]|uniref:DEAD/DEAH box helicase family protein n=1 Tax=Bradyrhizobium huanghuaihaiense TaxID=990078 RepID=UPI0021AAB820|nr:helicase-related protein [Bradyrhizobium sp. CB3035]UWU76208.1 helicase-related protein [Bradyrhizobium sp. CB3035]